MKFHNIRMVGPFNNEHLSSLPTFDTNKDPGRLVWLVDGSLWYGETDRWVKILASDNGGNTIHNDLDGRSDSDCHPISAITGLYEALRYAGMRWEMKDGSFQIEDHVGYLVDTTNGAVTATLPDLSGMAPSATLGMTTEIVDLVGNFDASGVVVDGNGEKIMGLNESLEMDTEWGSATFVYSDTNHGWIVTDGKSGGCGGSGSGHGMEWSIINSSINAQSFNGYFVDTENNAVTLTLTSTPQQGDIIRIIDYNGFANTNNITIDPNGFKINGDASPFVIDTDRTSLFLVYSDAIEGWEIFDSNRSTNNIIDVDTTIYLAPSASNQSPTGVPVGSDITGDGSLTKPFYSIKMAMEYLEDYRIKVGVYVTIRGLAGTYNYNNVDHSTIVKHKDAKYIKIKYDMYDASNYHETTITTDTVTQDTSHSDYDLIEFTVNDIGSGFYQIQAGDYIKIYSDNAYWSLREYAVWNGYYKVSSVDVVNKKITIIFKRHQIGGSYNSNHSYLLPNTPSANNRIHVVKLSTSVCCDITTDETFFKSNFGFGSIQINLCNTNADFTGTGVEIYDGVIDDIYFNINGFKIGVTFDNLKANILDVDSKYYNTFTSCVRGLDINDTSINIMGFAFNCCRVGIQVNGGSKVYFNDSIKSEASNQYYHGYNVYSSSFHIGSTYTQRNILNAFYNSTGIAGWFGSSINGVGYNCRYNYTGVGLYASTMMFYGQVNSSTSNSTLHYNSIGMHVQFNSNINISYVYAYGNGTGIKASSSSIDSGSVGADLGSDSFRVYSSTGNNIECDGCDFIRLVKGNITNAGNANIIFDACPKVKFSDTDISNGVYGIEATRGSYVFYYTTSSSYNIHDNSSYNVLLYFGSRFSSYVKAAIPANVSPSKNTTPSYSGSNGTWLLETTY